MNQQYYEAWERNGCQEYSDGTARFKLTPKSDVMPTKESQYKNTQYIGGIIWKLKERK